MSDPTCDNLCRRFRFIGYYDDPDSICPVSMQLDMAELIKTLKHCGDFCCPTVASALSQVGGGTCVVVKETSEEYTIVRMRDTKVISGPGKIFGPDGVTPIPPTPIYIRADVTNPFSETSLLDVTVKCGLLVDQNTMASGFYIVSENLSETPVDYGDVLKHFENILLVETTGGTGGASHATLLTPMDENSFFGRTVANNGFLMKYRRLLEPGETVTLYSQAFVKVKTVPGAVKNFCYFHSDMVMSGNIHRGYIEL